MRAVSLRAFLARPTIAAVPLVGSLGRLAIFLFGVEVITGSLLALYYRPVPEAAYASVEYVTNAVSLGWLMRNLHRAAGHALVVVAGLFLAREYFRRAFLRPAGGWRWVLHVLLASMTVAFLLSGETLRWDQTAYWRTVVAANQISDSLLFGGPVAAVLGLKQVASGTALIRLYVLHTVILPWLFFGGIVAARALARREANG